MDFATLAPADRHRAAAETFTGLIAGTSDWQASTPVKEWAAIDVVGHLIDWLPGMLEGGGVELTVADVESAWRTDPLAAWKSRAAIVQEVLDDPAKAGATYRSPMLGEMPMVDLLDRFWTADIYMHSWDLARAGGLPLDLDEAYAAEMLTGMESMEEMIRGSGQFGVRQPVADDAPTVDKLIAFIGRDPNWSR
ncbi:TIGR03086 family metal-binding protein [Tomitella biformata]|uniref:TIGR03086 family metal-binding protein n=1 Tax=Tomitella biformata TaxID=630403 RepID=UPI0004646432|nr:TIGR03086 family metal-binding protein [Tomitella biformata]